MKIFQVIVMSTLPLALFANPEGADFGTQSVDINSPHSHTLEITTHAPKSIINWKQFSIDKGEITRFYLPNGEASVLNRVITANPSCLMGKLESNGQVYLINPAGILVGKEGVVHTASFIASTLDVHDNDFLNGMAFTLSGDSQQKVINLGEIYASQGHAFLVGQHVENHGIMEAIDGVAAILPCGSVVIKPNDDTPFFIKSFLSPNDLNSAGNPYTTAFKPDAEPDALDVVKENGEVYLVGKKSWAEVSGKMTSKNRDQTGGNVYVLGSKIHLQDGCELSCSHELGGGHVRVGGGFQGNDEALANAEFVLVGREAKIEANALTSGHGGEVIVWSDKATAFYGRAEVDAGRTQGDGGFIEISSQNHLTYQGQVSTTAPHGNIGRVLFDPNDINIDAGATSGGPFPATATFFDGGTFGTATLNAGELVAALNNPTNVTIQTSNVTAGGSGDINFNVAVAWAGAGSLTVNSTRDTNVNADISNTGTGSFTVNAGRDYNSSLGSAVTMGGAGGAVTVTAASNINLLGSLLNTDPVSGAPVNVTATTGNITINNAASTVPVVIGNIVGPVVVEATLGDIIMQGGSMDNDVAQIGYFDVLDATASSGPITVRAGRDLSMLGGAGGNAGAFISRNGAVARNITGDIVVTVRRDILIRSGPGITSPGSGIGRPQVIFIPASYVGDVTVNTGNDCRIWGGNNFSGIGVRGNSLTGMPQESRITLNIGNDLILGHDPANPVGRSGGFVGSLGIPFFPISYSANTRGTIHINTGNNLIFDARLGSAFGEFTNDNGNPAYPPELFVHSGRDIILIGGPTITGAFLAAAFDYIDSPNSTSHFWARGSINCINGRVGSANLHAHSSRPAGLADNRNLGTISARAGGDIKVAGGGVGRFNIPVSNYYATGGFTYVADSGFATGELWPALSATVGGVNVFNGTLLAIPSLSVTSNGLGAIQFDTNFYATELFPAVITGVNSLAPLVQTGVGNTITYGAQDGSDIFMSTQDRFADGTPADILNIGTTGASIQFDNALLAGTMPFTANGRDITIIHFRDTFISGDPGLSPAINAPSGSILVITQNDMHLNNNAIVSAGINVDLVTDNQAPTPPQIGPGGFFMDGTSIISADTGYIRVYTARQAINIIDPAAQFISNGAANFFIPGDLFVDTDQEKWCTYYPNGDQGIPFKIFYKPCIETFTMEAQIILTEFLYEESSFNYYLGWPERFKVFYKTPHDARPKTWRSTQSSFDSLPTEYYYIRRQDDTRANNNPRTYLAW